MFSEPGTIYIPVGKQFRALAIFCVVAVLLIGGLYVATLGEPSVRSDNPEALQTPVTTADQGCQQFADFWLGQTGLGLDAGVISGLTNCWQDASGNWFVPNSTTDPRMPAGFRMTDAESSSAEASRLAIFAELTEFDAQINGRVAKSTNSIYSRFNMPIVGHVSDLAPFADPRSSYARAMQAFLMAPEHGLLAQYVGWLMAPRIAAYETLRDRCVSDPDTKYLVTVCRGLEDSLSIFYPPWPWDMRDTVNLEAFLAQRVRGGSANDVSVG